MFFFFFSFLVWVVGFLSSFFFLVGLGCGGGVKGWDEGWGSFL